MTSGAGGFSGKEESADTASVTRMSPRRLKREEYGFPPPAPPQRQPSAFPQQGTRRRQVPMPL